MNNKRKLYLISGAILCITMGLIFSISSIVYSLQEGYTYFESLIKLWGMYLTSGILYFLALILIDKLND